MQQVKTLVLAVMAAFALCATAAAVALGAVELLTANKAPAKEVTFKGANRKETQFTILRGFLIVKCSEVAPEGEQDKGTLLGLFRLLWHGCTTNLGGTCTGLGEPNGIIAASGTWHLVFDKLLIEGSLGVGILLLFEHFHFTCEGGIVPKTLVLVLGEALCLVTPIDALSPNLTITCTMAKERGDPGETVYWNENGMKVEMGESGLLASENEGTETMAALECTMEVAVTIAPNNEVEVMG